MIGNGHPVVGLGVKQFGAVRRLALDAEQDVESSGPGWRDRRSRVSGLRFHFCQYDGSRECGKEIRLPYGPSFSPGSG